MEVVYSYLCDSINVGPSGYLRSEHFGQFCKSLLLLTCRIINIDMLSQVHNQLLQVALLIEENYGQEFITPNIHLSLHITDCCEDYGPLYSFWCYSFERMNGLLGNKLFLLFLCLKNKPKSTLSA